MKISHLTVAAALLALLASTGVAVEHGVLDVVENDTGNATTSVTVTKRSGTADFDVRSGSNRGDYNVQIGGDHTDDQANGIFLTSTYKNFTLSSSPDPSGFDNVGINTSFIERSGGGYFIPTARAPYGNEWNSDTAAVYFPNDENWFAGHLFNSGGANGGALDAQLGSSAVVLGTNVIDQAGGSGRHEVFVPGVTDARRQGILFATGGKNEDNYGASSAAFDGSKYWLTTKDNGANGGSYEQDPVAFAFIPTGTPGVVMGRVSGQGIAVLKSGNFTVEPVLTSSSTDDNDPDGVYRLDIPGHFSGNDQIAATGTLLLTPENSLTGDNQDNIVTAEPADDGQGWIINARDLPGDPLPSLQATFNQNSFKFAFFPNDGAASTPGAIQTTESMGWDSSLSSVVGANVDVTENDPGNNTGSNSAVVSSGTPGIIVPTVNRADIGLAMGGDYFREPDGVMFASVTENRNSTVGTPSDNGGAVNPNTSIQGGAWMVHTQMANGNGTLGDGVSGGNTETNVDFSTAFFQTSSGFQFAANVDTPGGLLDVIPGTDITGVPTTGLVDEGVLIAGGYGNDDNYATVSVLSDAQGDFWAIDLRDNGGNPEGDSVNYVWIPFSGTDAVAARIAEDGSVIASTEEGGNANFTLTRQSAGTYELAIPGVTPDDGMLLMNGALADTGNGEFGGAIMSYEDSGNGTFIIQTLEVTAENTYAIDDFEFQFAYVDFGIPDGLVGDYNGDGTVDLADYTIWRNNLGEDASVLPEGTRDPLLSGVIGTGDYNAWKNNFGNSILGGGVSAAGQNVPEPSTVGILALALVAVGAYVRRNQ